MFNNILNDEKKIKKIKVENFDIDFRTIVYFNAFYV